MRAGACRGTRAVADGAAALRRVASEAPAGDREVGSAASTSSRSVGRARRTCCAGSSSGAGRRASPSVWAGRKARTAYVHVLEGEPAEEDVAVLRRARRAQRPGDGGRGRGSLPTTTAIPYVLATDVVRVGAGEAFPLEAIARAIAARLGERGAPLAARVPLLREAVSEQLVAAFARKERPVARSCAVEQAVPICRVLALNELPARAPRRAGLRRCRHDPLDRLPELVATRRRRFRAACPRARASVAAARRAGR